MGEIERCDVFEIRNIGNDGQRGIVRTCVFQIGGQNETGHGIDSVFTIRK
jgi:hypothetical protein